MAKVAVNQKDSNNDTMWKESTISGKWKDDLSN